MKKRFVVTTALACMLAAGTVSAQTPNEMMQGTGSGTTSTQQTSPAMGPGMMGGGMGMGPGMMGGGMGMGPGMMGSLEPEAQQKYLDATRDLRKKMQDKQFDYIEAARNPKANKADLLKKRKELWDIQQKLHEKVWEFMKE